MKSVQCVIIASGKMALSNALIDRIRNADLIICADGGARHLKRMKIMPHILIGDFDSIDPEDKAVFEKNNVRVVTYPVRKDKTDSELCIDYALDQKATDITLYGFTGTRMDHTLANIFLLKKIARENVSARIIDETNEILLVTQKTTIQGQPGESVSIIPISEKVTGIVLEGFEYPLTEASMEMGSSLGISNRLKETKATIRIKSGLLLVTRSKD